MLIEGSSGKSVVSSVGTAGVVAVGNDGSALSEELRVPMLLGVTEGRSSMGSWSIDVVVVVGVGLLTVLLLTGGSD